MTRRRGRRRAGGGSGSTAEGDAARRSGGGGRAGESRGSHADRGKSGRRDEFTDRPSRLSYVVAAVSGAIVLALACYLVVQAVSPSAPADVRATASGPPRAAASGWVVPLDVRNEGDAAVKEVLVEVVVGTGGEATELTTVDYLAGGEEQRVYVVLEEDPVGRAVSARVRGYQEP